MVGLERTILIEGAGQIAAPSWHGHAAESIVCTRLILIYGTAVPGVIGCGGPL
jgi:hypothetical protein